MKQLWQQIITYKYLVALASVFLFLLTPVPIAIAPDWASEIVLINYTLVILASSLIAANRSTKLHSYILGTITLFFVWMEFYLPYMGVIKESRLLSSLALFTYFFFLLMRQLKNMKGINLHFIMGPILGFVYMGIIGGILFEGLNLLNPSSFYIKGDFSTYLFYYFSFISVTTVGYGDVTPATAPAQSITLVLNIINQFYLAIVIAVFVGKYSNIKT